MSFPWERPQVAVRDPRAQGMPPQYAQGVDARQPPFAQYQQAQQQQVQQLRQHQVQQRRYQVSQQEQLAAQRQHYDPKALSQRSPYGWPDQGEQRDDAVLQADMARMRLADTGRAARALYGGSYNVGHPDDRGGGRPAPVIFTPAYPSQAATRPSGIPAVESAGVVPLPYEGGLVGLVNLGNSCFLNCVVQCLAHTLPFVGHVIFNLEQDLQQHLLREEEDRVQGATSDADSKLAVVRAFIALLGHIWSGAHAGPLEPRTLMWSLRSDPRCCMLFNCKQQDAHECLLLLLDMMHTDTNGMITSERAPYAQRAHVPGDGYVEIASPVTQGQEDDGWSMLHNGDVDAYGEVQGLQASALGDGGSSNGSVTDLDSVVSKYMKGMSSTEVRCTACNYSCQNKEKFFVISLPIPEKGQQGKAHNINGAHNIPSGENIATLEDCFHLYENAEEEMSWVCDRCRQTRASKSMKILSYPKILIIHLQRFGYVNGRRFKRDESVAVPATFFRPVNPRSSATKGDSAEVPQYQYDIYGWCEHLGQTDDSGHYTAVARHIDGSFRRYDDHNVINLPDMPSVMKTKTAYILFYERREAPVRRPL